MESNKDTETSLKESESEQDSAMIESTKPGETIDKESFVNELNLTSNCTPTKPPTVSTVDKSGSSPPPLESEENASKPTLESVAESENKDENNDSRKDNDKTEECTVASPKPETKGPDKEESNVKAQTTNVASNESPENVNLDPQKSASPEAEVPGEQRSAAPEAKLPENREEDKVSIKCEPKANPEEQSDDIEQRSTTPAEDKVQVDDDVDEEEAVRALALAAEEEEDEDEEVEVPVEGKEEPEVNAEAETAAVEADEEDKRHEESSLPTDLKVQEKVAKWVRNSIKADSKRERMRRQEEEEDEEEYYYIKTVRRGGRRRRNAVGPRFMPKLATRKSQRVISNSLKRSNQSLNTMHGMDNGSNEGAETHMKKNSDESRQSPKVPHSRQNGAALPEEGATLAVENARNASIKKEPGTESAPEGGRLACQNSITSLKSAVRNMKQDKGREDKTSRKRSSTDDIAEANDSPVKRICAEQREQYIMSIVDCENADRDELDAKSEQIRAELKTLDELLRAKEMEWNEILSLKKLKEEAYDRLQRKRQVMNFIDSNGSQQMDGITPASQMSLSSDWDSSNVASKDKREVMVKSENRDSHDKKDKSLKRESDGHSRQSTPPKQISDSSKKQQMLIGDAQNLDNRQIGEGRQGPIVDVRSIIADYRLKHPESVPRRGRRLRNSVNINLGAGGAVVENVQNVDSRPSSTDSCKSNPNMSDPNNSMSFRDVLVQFAKLSQQQGEPVKTPQNYPDVTLHPVAPSPINVPQSGAAAHTHSQPSSQAQPQQTTSLLHGILTKSQSPRLTTFSPTLARLLTAPERERNTSTVTSAPPQPSQHLLQTYQGSNPVSISELLSSSKARTEITITPVVNPPVPSHSSNLIQVDDAEDDSTILEERDCRVTNIRDHREDRDSPPRCQGCLERAAQFVCAGCGNQWYCSRECQVSAWDEHSEVCSG